MTSLESMIDLDTQTLYAIAESFPHINIIHKAVGNALPHRWEVQLIEPRRYLGKIELTATEICQPDTQRRIVLRRELLRILGETGQNR